MRTFASVSSSLYPWDVVGDPDGAVRIAEVGVDRVTLPVLYHAVRADTLRHPEHRIVATDVSTLFSAPDPAVWADVPFRPADGARWAGPDSFGRARDQLRAVGLAVDAWCVLDHADSLAGADDAHVVNAIGDRYEWTLCPRATGVEDYARAALRSVGDADGVMLEACGSYGYAHLSAHDKTASAGFTTTDVALLSVCFCVGCRGAMTEVGLDPTDLARRVLARLGKTDQGVPARSGLRSALGEDVARALARVRADGNRALQRSAVAEARQLGYARISFQASPDPWATDFSAFLADGTLDIDVAIVNCTGDEAAVREGLDGVAAILGGRDVRRGAFSSLPDHAVDAELVARWTQLASWGADELHLYHLGIATTSTLQATARALATLP